MSAWSRCGQPSCWQMPFFHSMLRGIVGQAWRPKPLAASPPPRRRRTGGRRSARAAPTGLAATDRAIRLSLDPATRWSTRTPTRRSGPGRKSRRCSARSSTPSRYSTTTPSSRRSSPQTFSTSSASCRPSTKIRLAPGDARLGAGYGDRAGRRPRGDLPGPEPGRRHQDHRHALQQEAGAEREGAPLAAPVLEGHGAQVALDGDDLAAPVGGDLLDDQARVGLDLHGATAPGGAPVGVEDVGSVAVDGTPEHGSRGPRDAARQRAAPSATAGGLRKRP